MNRNSNRNQNRSRNNRTQGNQNQGRQNGSKTTTIAREMGSQISREVGKAIGQLGNQLAKTLSTSTGGRKPRNQDQPSKSRRGAKGQQTHSTTSDKHGRGKDSRNQDQQVRDNKRTGKVQAWQPSLNKANVEGNEKYLVAALPRLVNMIKQSVGFEAPVAEIRYEISKHLSEMQNSDSGKVEANGFKAELANTNYSFDRVATLAAMGAIPVIMVEALFNGTSKKDLQVIANLVELRNQTGGKSGGITVMAPFTINSGKAAVQSVLDQVEIAHLAKLSPKDSDPFKQVEEMISSPFGQLCAYVDTTPAQVIAKARTRATESPSSSTTSLRKVS